MMQSPQAEQVTKYKIGDYNKEQKVKTDAQLQTDVMEALKWDPSVSHEHIGVTVADGVVTLTGSAPTFVEKWAAEKIAQRVAGVKAVVEKIEVRLLGIHKRDDQDIAKAILNQFMWSVQVPDESIQVKVQDGWVTLSGEVDWEYQRSAAEKNVRSLAGVRGVSNDIALKQKKIQPALVKEKIQDALKREAERSARKISIEVKGNKVVLTGDVHSFAEMEDAKWAAWSAPGVSTVENRLNVSDSY